MPLKINKIFTCRGRSGGGRCRNGGRINCHINIYIRLVGVRVARQECMMSGRSGCGRRRRGRARRRAIVLIGTPRTRVAVVTVAMMIFCVLTIVCISSSIGCRGRGD